MSGGASRCWWWLGSAGLTWQVRLRGHFGSLGREATPGV